MLVTIDPINIGSRTRQLVLMRPALALLLPVEQRAVSVETIGSSLSWCRQLGSFPAFRLGPWRLRAIPYRSCPSSDWAPVPDRIEPAQPKVDNPQVFSAKSLMTANTNDS